MALATTTDLEAALGRSLTSAETGRATYLLRAASAAVLSETGFKFEAGTYTVGRFVRGGKVRLPASAPTVTAVREIGQADGGATTLTLTTDYTVRDSTIYGLGGSCFVEVDFTVASGAVPQEVVDVVAGIAAATISGPATGVSAQAAGAFQVSYVDSSGRVWFSKSDRLILAKYRVPKNAIRL